MESGEACEGLAKIDYEPGIFYNPHMELSRNISSAVVSQLGDLNILDAFSATGIRGIRYKKENSNVKKIEFLDYSKKACILLKKNLKKNRIRAKVHNSEINRFLWKKPHEFNFIELDPFGTPQPYIYSAIKSMESTKTCFLSATATDLPVLCGVQQKACIREYNSKPLKNDFCHETALRILIKKIAEIGAEMNFGCTPVVSFYNRHHVKTIVKLEKSSILADKTLGQFSCIEFCWKCGFTREAEFPEKNCPLCSSKLDYAGKLWIGKLHSEKEINGALSGIKDNKKIEEKTRKMLFLFSGENDCKPWLYSTHWFAKKAKTSSIGMETLLKTAEKEGIDMKKTHFDNIAFKSKNSFEEICSFMKNIYKKR